MTDLPTTNRANATESTRVSRSKIVRFVVVELHGGFDHYGFVALAEGVNSDVGSRKLIDGLFYYTE